ncbi:hypothetical protein K503DRAFT_767966 [Rhizopogon vinicolor AM-OR11-026]|uniref:Uncharacterized protein n=1 Tax=Rhizopogon vinicolor AM-OR11-026 TaxID=1314800 RepID=A0A1B7N8D1_9AGAM|nr:hypothetical protein K503DRAFT_767966 [Rhizopogon vinicolor AM-OR11-026]
MRTAPTYSALTSALGIFPPPKTAEYVEHGYPIDTPHSMPPTFWRPAPKVQNVKLMVLDSAMHRKSTNLCLYQPLKSVRVTCRPS